MEPDVTPKPSSSCTAPGMAAGPGVASPTGCAPGDTPSLRRRSPASASARICFIPASTSRLHIADVLSVIKYEQLRDFVLVGHSYGGCVISGVAEAMPDAIHSIVFLDAFIPDNGDSTFDLVQPAVQEVIRGALARGEITVPVRDAAAFKVNEKDRAWVDSLATPQPIGTMTEKITLSGARERIAKKTYIRASGYPNVSFEKAHARAKADPSWRTYEVPCGHDVMIDAPERLTEILLELG